MKASPLSLTPVFTENPVSILFVEAVSLIIDADSFIQQIFVETLSSSVLAACQLRMPPNLVISALFVLPWKPVPDSLLCSAYCSRSTKLVEVPEYSLGEPLSRRIWRIRLSSLILHLPLFFI